MRCSRGWGSWGVKRPLFQSSSWWVSVPLSFIPRFPFHSPLTNERSPISRRVSTLRKPTFLNPFPLFYPNCSEKGEKLLLYVSLGAEWWGFLAITYFWFTAVPLIAKAARSLTPWDQGFTVMLPLPLLLASHSRMYSIIKLFSFDEENIIYYICLFNLEEWNSFPTK